MVHDVTFIPGDGTGPELTERPGARSDLCAAMIVGLGMAGGANIGTEAASEKVTYDLKPSRTDPTAVGTNEFADAVIEEMNA